MSRAPGPGAVPHVAFTAIDGQLVYRSGVVHRGLAVIFDYGEPTVEIRTRARAGSLTWSNLMYQRGDDVVASAGTARGAISTISVRGSTADVATARDALAHIIDVHRETMPDRVWRVATSLHSVLSDVADR